MWQIFVCTLQCATRRAGGGGRRSVLVASSSHHPPDGLPSPHSLSPRPPVARRGHSVLQHSLILTAQPASVDWWLLLASLVIIITLSATQHINNLPTLSPLIPSMILSSLPPSPASWESAEAHSGQPAQALTSLDPKC